MKMDYSKSVPMFNPEQLANLARLYTEHLERIRIAAEEKAALHAARVSFSADDYIRAHGMGIKL